MRIGLDHFPAATHAPGVGRYAREFTRALIRERGAHDLRLLAVGRAPEVMDEDSLGLTPDVLRLRLPLPARLLSLTAKVGLGADGWLGGVDVFHQVRLHGPPVTRAPQTFAVSEWPARERQSEFLNRLADFAGLFVFSEEYKSRLVERAGRDPRTIWQVPVGADHWWRDLGATPRQFERSDPPRILVLGAAFAERRHALILDACEQLVAGGRDLRLMFAGSESIAADTLRPLIAASGISSKVEWRSPLESEMPALVAGSSLLVHLCDDAGTAVTPLESLLLGVPVLVSPVPAFREVLEGHANFFQGDGCTKLAQAIESTLSAEFDDSAHAELLQRYSWRANARTSLRAWEELLG